jgi:hypothetical protein
LVKITDGGAEKRVLRKIFGANKEKIKRERTRLNNEKLHNLHSTSDITSVFKSLTVNWQIQLRHKENAFQVKTKCDKEKM